MIFKANLVVCFVFILAVVAIVGFVVGFGWPTADDVVWLLAFMSPIAIWVPGAWIVRRHRRTSVVWLSASILPMVVGLAGIYVDVAATREEARTGVPTMHLAAFAAMLLQWFPGRGAACGHRGGASLRPKR